MLVIVDDEVIAQGIARHLTAAGLDPTTVASGEAGLARLRYERPDVCVLDLMLPGADGWKVIETARAEGIGTPKSPTSAQRPAAVRVSIPRRQRSRLTSLAHGESGSSVTFSASSAPLLW